MVRLVKGVHFSQSKNALLLNRCDHCKVPKRAVTNDLWNVTNKRDDC